MWIELCRILYWKNPFSHDTNFTFTKLDRVRINLVISKIKIKTKREPNQKLQAYGK